jgi:GNAT superfamily N-acetyltransferase
MVAAVLRRQAEGLVRFDPLRHLGPVAELVSISFAGELGPEARHTLRRMRQIARWGGLGMWLLEVGSTAPPGFVWLEGGQVVGNTSLRRAALPGGWMIGNVAVHPDWRGQGIARALMDAAVETVAKRGGTWIGLEVREDNDIASGLYRRMGFDTVGKVLEMSRPAGLQWPPIAVPSLQLRRAGAADNESLYRLALAGIGPSQIEVLEIRRSTHRADLESRLAAWMDGRREEWWMVEREGRAVGALSLSRRPRAHYHRISVLAQPEWMYDLGPELVQAGMAKLLRRRSWEIVTDLPGSRQDLEPSFAAFGFQKARCLVQMRLMVSRRA